MFLGARSNSTRLRADVDNLQTQCANDMWSAWNNTNTSLQQRVTESTEAHNKLQSHLSKTMQEIYDQVHSHTLLKSSYCYARLLELTPVLLLYQGSAHAPLRSTRTTLYFVVFFSGGGVLYTVMYTCTAYIPK